MQVGRPFHTEKLDEFRATQREQLRFISDWIVSGVSGECDELELLEDENERIIAERELREYAHQVADEMGESLTVASRSVPAAITTRFLSGNSNPRGMQFEFALADFQKAQATAKQGVQLAPDETHAIRRLTLALVFADELAGDYRDPRVKFGK